MSCARLARPVHCARSGGDVEPDQSASTGARKIASAWHDVAHAIGGAVESGRHDRLGRRPATTARLPQVSDPVMNQRPGRRVKRWIDVVLASAALVLLAPVMTVVAVAILVTQGRPILFRQRRPGYLGRPFTIVKFRTMRAPRPGETWYRTDERRLTRLGRFLRTSSIDELPELWNVVNGEMSLVGPRPLLMQYLETYTPRQARRHDVLPGVTSWAIVNGRNGLGFAERLELDVQYVERWSLRLDARILLMTISQVLRRTGAEASQDVDELGFPLASDHPSHGPDGRPDPPPAP
jgi:sugar transferase EpsL